MKVLIVVDMQEDFIRGALGSDEACAVIPGIVEKIKNFNGVVIATEDAHEQVMERGYIEHDRVPKHCIDGTFGATLVPEILAALNSRDKMNTFIQKKNTFGIRDAIRMVGDKVKWAYGDATKVESIELCGVCTDICVVSNAIILRSMFPKATITVDASCCAGTSEEAHKAALTTMKSCLIDIVNEEE